MFDLFGNTSSSSDSSIGVDVAPEQTFSLSAEQSRALSLVKSGKSLFISGAGGTGKSVLIGACQAWAKSAQKRVSITATTGVAACNVGGVTVHSWSGLSGRELDTMINNPGIISRNLITFVKKKMRKQARSNWLGTDLLVIDEISMLDARALDLLDHCGQIVHS